MADNALMRYSAPDGMFPPNALTPRQPELRAYDEPWYRAVPNVLSEWMGLGPSGREIMRNALGPSNPLNIPAQAQEAGHEIGGGLATGDYARAGMGGLGLAMAIGPGPRFFPRGVRAPAEPPNVVPQGIPAVHVSPHNFDRFDISRVGTGMGRMDEGHGLYFSSPDAFLTEGYAKSIGPNARRYDVRLNVNPNRLLDWDKLPRDMQEILKTPQGAAAAVKSGAPGAIVRGGKYGDSYIMFDASPVDILKNDLYAPPH